MSDLRKQLREFQDDYASLKYPGDLAADVMGKSQQSKGGGWVKLAVGIAAAMTLAGLVWVGLDRQSPPEIAGNPPEMTTPAETLIATDDHATVAVPTLIAAKPAETTTVERPTWTSVAGSDDDRPSFSSIGGMSLQYQSLSLPTQSEVQQIRYEQQQQQQSVEGTQNTKESI